MEFLLTYFKIEIQKMLSKALYILQFSMLKKICRAENIDLIMDKSHVQAISTLKRSIDLIRIFSHPQFCFVSFICANSKFYFFVAVRSERLL